MASHRKPRTPILATPGGRRTATGLTTAALASVTLLSQTANAAPKAPQPSIEEVKTKVDDLYQQAEVATQKYNGAKEKADGQQRTVNRLLDEAARRADKMNESRRRLGAFASAQYQSGGINPTAQLMLAKDPQQFVDRNHLMEQLTAQQKQAITDYQAQAAAATRQRAQATSSLESLQQSQTSLKENKRNVQAKLAEARQLLSRLTAQEKARLAELERQKEAEAQRKAAEQARKEAQQRQQQPGGSGSGQSSGGGTSDGGTYSTKAGKAIAFARTQIGKPYVWGATGPSSYDCSGLTQAAWRAAGVDLPRTTWDQVKVGTRVSSSDLQPGDLVFFFNDISHVGMYIGGGEMIHAPHAGAPVEIAPIDRLPFAGATRPG